MTFTGRNGSRFEPREHITMEEIEELLSTKPGIGTQDFFPLSSYHPLCYSAAYYIVHAEQLISLTKLLDREIIEKMSGKGYILSPDQDLSTTSATALTAYGHPALMKRRSVF